MAFSFKKFFGGINLVPQNSTAVSADGDLRYNSSTNKLELYNGGVDSLLTEADTATITNKTIDGNDNTLINIPAGNLIGDVTSTGLTTVVAKIQGTVVSGTTGSTNVVFSNSPTLVTPALGTPTALVGTNITGTAASLTAGHVTTNANLTGDITSVGNATTLATVNSNVGTFASAAFNAKGLATSASALSGDITTSGSVSTLATVNSNVGSFINSSVTVNSKGLITAASTGSANIASSGNNNNTATDATFVLVGACTITTTGGPVLVGMNPVLGTIATDSAFYINGSVVNMEILITMNGGGIASSLVGAAGSGLNYYGAAVANFVDLSAIGVSGSRAYEILIRVVQGTGTVGVQNLVLTALEVRS